MRHWNFEVDLRANGFVVAGDQYARDKRLVAPFEIPPLGRD